MRVGHMTLSTDNGEFACQGAAPAIFNDLTHCGWVCRLTHKTEIRHYLLLLHPFDHFHGAMNGISFLITGDNEAQRACINALRICLFYRCDETGNTALHISCTTPIKTPL